MIKHTSLCDHLYAVSVQSSSTLPVKLPDAFPYFHALGPSTLLLTCGDSLFVLPSFFFKCHINENIQYIMF